MSRGFLEGGLYRLGTTQAISVTSTSTAIGSAFGAQTFGVRLSVGAVSATSTVVHYRVGDGTQTATTSDPVIPNTWVETILVSPGQRLSAICDATGTATLLVTELTQ